MKTRWLVLTALVIAGGGALFYAAGRQPAAQEQPPAPPPPPARPAAANLRLSAGAAPVPAARLLDADAPEWAAAHPLRLAMHETPRLYATDPPPGGPAPQAEARALRATDGLALRIAWRDATRDVAEVGAPREHPNRATSARPSRATDRFFDAVAVMVPEEMPREQFPSLQMGDADHPVRLYFWEAVRGARVMTAKGRATTKPTGDRFPAKARYQDGGWTVTMTLPPTPAGMPLAWAIWDGHRQHRDGRKFFSVWYVLE